MSTIWRALLEFLFRLLYRELAWSYDWVSRVVSLGHWREWQRLALRYVRGSELLELACGTGNLLLDWHAAGWAAVGLDLSPQMVRLARRKLLVYDIPLRLTRARAQALPFSDATFDSVVATLPAEFIVQPATLKEVRRILRPGGRLVVVLGAALTGRDLRSRVIEWLYAITGQRPSLPPLDELMLPDGLSARWERVAEEGWEALLLVGEKAQDDGLASQARAVQGSQPAGLGQ
ncbi:MAG: class I SAM-dependent methyltransferase [Chloroflexota bacterium]